MSTTTDTTTATMTDAEKYLHQAKLNRERQKRWYEKNKEKVLAKKKEVRNQTIEPREKTTADLPDNASITSSLKNHTPTEDIGASSFKKYADNLKDLIRITDCEHLLECLKKPKEIIRLITTAISNRGTPYKANSKKAFITAVLTAVEQLNLKVSASAVKQYKHYDELLDIEVANEVTQNVNLKVEKFSKYLENVKNEYGETSTFYLLARLYNEATVRDNYGDLKIIRNDNESINDNLTNYIKVPKKFGTAKVFINKHKTSKKGSIIITLSSELTKLIKNYMEVHKMKEGDSLFGVNKNGLTDYISKANKKLGYKGAVNLFRHMKIAEQLDNDGVHDPELRLRLAKDMGHSPAIQLTYNRVIED